MKKIRIKYKISSINPNKFTIFIYYSVEHYNANQIFQSYKPKIQISTKHSILENSPTFILESKLHLLSFILSVGLQFILLKTLIFYD